MPLTVLPVDIHKAEHRQALVMLLDADALDPAAGQASFMQKWLE